MATYTLTGPTSGTAGQASSNFTVTVDSTVISTSVVITPNDGGVGGGTFTPSSLTFTAASTSKTFTYTPASNKTVTISTTNGSGYTNPASISFTAGVNWQTIAMQILWAEDVNRGGFFFYELQRDGSMNDATVAMVRDAYLTYKTARSQRPSFSPAHEDTGTAVHGIDSPGDQVPGAWR